MRPAIDLRLQVYRFETSTPQIKEIMSDIYDNEVARMTANPELIYRSWLNNNLLFRPVTRNGKESTDSSCTCPLYVNRHDFRCHESILPELKQAIKAMPLISMAPPATQAQVDTLHFYAEAQRLADKMIPGRVVPVPENFRTPGQVLFFEYHCNESHDSSDAQLWYRSHQKVTVLRTAPNDGMDILALTDRCEHGQLIVYLVLFADGHQGHAFEDELLDSDADYCRPQPPAPRSGN